MNCPKTQHIIVRSFLMLLTVLTTFTVRAADCPAENAKMVIKPAGQPAEYLLSFSTEGEFDFAHLSVYVTYLDANYPSKNQEYHMDHLTDGDYEQNLQFDLNGKYSIYLYVLSPDCFIDLEDTIEVVGAEHSMNCSASMEVELLNEDLGIYEVTWPEVSFNFDLPKPYHFTAEHQFYEYGDSIVRITVPTTLASVKRLKPRGYNDYFTDEGNVIYKQTEPYVHLSPRRHMYLETGEYIVKGRRSYSFEDAAGEMFQCDVTGEATLKMSETPAQPDCDSWKRDIKLQSHAHWANEDLKAGKRMFSIKYLGLPQTDDLMEHDALAFWFEAREIHWDFGDGEGIVLERTSALLDYHHSNYSIRSHEYTHNGSYIVSFRVISMSGCTLMETSEVIEITELEEEFACEELEVSILHEDLPYGQNYRFTFSHNLSDLTGAGTTFDKVVWKFDDSQVFEQETVDYMFRTNGEHTVGLEVFYEGCQRTFQEVVKTDESFCNPWDFSALFNYWPEKDSVYMMARNTGSSYRYTWQAGKADSTGLGLSSVVMPLDKDNETVLLKMTIEDTNAHSPYYGIVLSDSVVLNIAPQSCAGNVLLTPSISPDEPRKVSFRIAAGYGLDFYSMTFGDGHSHYGSRICFDEEGHSDIVDHTYVASGTYEVQLYVITSDRCIVSLKQEVKITTIPDPADEEGDIITGFAGKKNSSGLITAYPNPATNELYISTKNMEPDMPWSVVDLTGKNMLVGQLNGTDSKIDVGMLPAGLYILRIGIPGEEHLTRIVVNP